MEWKTLLYAAVAVLAWGSWLVPTQKVRFPNEAAKAFYVAMPNFVITLGLILGRGEWGALSRWAAWTPVLGGVIWVFSAYCAFLGCRHIGLAKAFGIWAPLNIVVSFAWGIFLFGQFREASLVLKLLAGESVLLVIGGMMLVIFSGHSGAVNREKGASRAWLGMLGALGAGVLWGSYYIPAAFLSSRAGGAAMELSPWAAAFPLAVGILLGSVVFMMFMGRSPVLERGGDYVRALISGALWTAGNFGMLLLVQVIGPGPGYALASLCVVVNALWGMFLFRDPPPRSRAALLLFLGIALSVLAGAVLGNLNTLEGR